MTDSPEAALHAYVGALEALDPETALPFYHVPSMFIAPHGVFVTADAAAVRAALAQFMGQLRSQGYQRTEVRGLEVRLLSGELASCTGVFVRFNASGQEIAKPGFTYIMRKRDGSWRIVVATIHDPGR